MLKIKAEPVFWLLAESKTFSNSHNLSELCRLCDGCYEVRSVL
jgi:hypothetical protein